MATDLPLISVIMAAQNEEAYLEQAIAGIEAQTYPAWELIVVNDGSTDGTGDIAAAAARRSPRIRTMEIPPPGVGVAEARNRGMAAAAGDLIAVADADDVAHPRRLEWQVSFFEEHPDIGAVGGWCEFVDVVTGERSTWRPPTEPREVRLYATRGNPIPHTTLTFRRDLLDEVDGYRDLDFKDYDFVVRLLSRRDGANLAQVLATVHVHPSSVMTGSRIRDLFGRGVRTRWRAVRLLAAPAARPVLYIRAVLLALVLLCRRTMERWRWRRDGRVP